MRATFLSALLGCALLAMTTPVSAEQLLYLASQGGKTITAYEVSAASGELTEKFKVEVPGSPGPLCYSPDGKWLYAATSGPGKDNAGVATYSRAADGTLNLAGTSKITSRTPYIRTSLDGGLLLAADYGNGDVTVYRIKDGICTDELLDQQVTERTAHCVELDRSGRFAFVPHTSPNKVYQFRLDTATGKLTANEPPFAAGPDEDHLYHQPRHIVFHPKLERAYTSNERGGGISVWEFNPQQGTLSLVQTLSSLPPNFAGNSAAADIHLTPDGRFAYVSNRHLAKADEQPQDTLAAFAVDPKSGRVKAVGHYPTGSLPRSFCIDLDGKFVYSAGQKSGTLDAYKIDQQSGALERIATYETGPVPIWVMCGRVSK